MSKITRFTDFPTTNEGIIGDIFKKFFSFIGGDTLKYIQKNIEDLKNVKPDQRIQTIEKHLNAITAKELGEDFEASNDILQIRKKTKDYVGAVYVYFSDAEKLIDKNYSPAVIFKGSKVEQFMTQDDEKKFAQALDTGINKMFQASTNVTPEDKKKLQENPNIDKAAEQKPTSTENTPGETTTPPGTENKTGEQTPTTPVQQNASFFLNYKDFQPLLEADETPTDYTKLRQEVKTFFITNINKYALTKLKGVTKEEGNVDKKIDTLVNDIPDELTNNKQSVTKMFKDILKTDREKLKTLRDNIATTLGKDPKKEYPL
jgi:hypothetical protein